MNIHRACICLLAALLLLWGLSACSGETTPTTEPTEPSSAVLTEAPASVSETEAPTPQSEVPTEPLPETPTDPSPEAPAETTAAQTAEPTEAPEAPGADSLDFEDAAALRDFLIGVWSYFPAEEDAVDSPEITGIPGISIQLLEDGSFYAIRQTDGVRFQGSWKLEHYFAEEGALPDRISFTLEEGGAPGAFGDYWIQGWASCAGTDRLLLTNIIYDADTFASFPEIYDAMLVKGSYDPDAEGSAPNCDAEFCGIVWQVTDGGTALWITEISPVDFTLAVGSRIAARYPVAADAELGYPVSVFARGGCPAVVKTNAAGEIVYLNWAEMDMEGN